MILVAGFATYFFRDVIWFREKSPGLFVNIRPVKLVRFLHSASETGQAKELE